ncbi:Cytochrome P450 monooxygenase TRI13 [Colletotrichum orbiculare MAFF 240422]|uniref:Cytochrome P450 monooxygenase TRI13 n=1 Tax=Colletotrichum orbiculare (strain 104-T / ATCC 96160 / CBS 514.97 / LARS 414 / MAFF 240422) TaxID=1213857 RepID=N4VRU5_COLOR|nr:Cytochrome P450 monooxygenase TRI13 [Colletotrichum orbiculare MAFF 240422]
MSSSIEPMSPLALMHVGLPTSSFGVLASAAAALSILLYALYQYLLPKPIQGIPYNEEATKTLLGDIHRIQKEAPNNPFGWMIEQARRRGSPVSQFFLEPFGKPSVVVTDFREGQDILMRRKEFDRSDFTIALLGGEARNFHINLKTGPEWKAHRRLLQDLMTPAFLHNVAAPNIYKSATRLLEVWKTKTRMAAGRPFLAEMDIFYAALDAVFDFGFGDAVEHRALVPQIAKLSQTSGVDLEDLHAASKRTGAVEFPCAPIHPAFQATLDSAETVNGVAASGFPNIAWWLIGLKPSTKRMRAVRDGFIKDQLLKAAQRYKTQAADGSDDYVKSAIDLMVHREGTFAAKEGREPVFWSDAMRDETIGFIMAGHDTTSTTLCWGIKFLADNPSAQQKLRESLRQAHASALAERHLPSHAEITRSNVPYLDAVVEEMLRLAHTAISQERQCKEDTVVLGHPIPKGTTVVVVNKGPGFTEPGFRVDEHLRSPSSQAAAKERGIRAWDEDGMDQFRPERWLHSDDGGAEVYDAAAGPTIPFGLGLRGCFGRKLAYMELKLLTTLLVWTFDLQKCPEELSSYDDIEGLTRKPTQCYVSLRMAE